MFRLLQLSFIVVLCSRSVAGSAETCQIKAYDLRAEYLKTPVLQTGFPRLSWKLQTVGNPALVRNQIQSAYRVLVASSLQILSQDSGDFWDTGIVNGSQTLNIQYRGLPVASSQQVFWKVFVWDGNGVACSESDASWWESGLLTDTDWKGQWIQRDDPTPPNDCAFYDPNPAPVLQTTFVIDSSKTVSWARCYIAGLGYFFLTIDGVKVGDHELDVPWTDFTQEVMYSTFDVSKFLTPGSHTLSITLGNGWYNPLPMRFWGSLNLREYLPTGFPKAILQLNIMYSDGSSQSVSTDTTWSAGKSPIIRNNIYLGIVYNASMLNEPQKLQNAVPAKPPGGRLVALRVPPAKIQEVIKPIAVHNRAKNSYIFDMGKNFAGGIRITVNGPTAAGQTIQLRYGELLYPDGSLNVMTSVAGQIKSANCCGPCAPPVAYQGDTFILKGSTTNEIYRTEFTWHGFRYVEWNCSAGINVSIDSLEGLRMFNDVEFVGDFSSSKPLFNQIHSMIRETVTSNLISGLQSDCPHRERFGYGGDVVASAEAIMHNFDMYPIYLNEINNFDLAIRPNHGITETAPYNGLDSSSVGGNSGPVDWQVVFMELQWQLYRYYGDIGILQHYYQDVKQWIDFLISSSTNYLITQGLGDWDPVVPSNVGFTSSCFFYQAVQRFSQVAYLLNNTNDFKLYNLTAQLINQSIHDAFYNPSTYTYASGTQCEQAFALEMGIVPDSIRDLVFLSLSHQIQTEDKNHFTVGIFGLKYLFPALHNFHADELASTLMSQTDYPSYGYMLSLGATTMWEVWYFSDNTYSHNHPMYGASSQWLFSLGGISIPGVHDITTLQSSDLAFGQIEVRPVILQDLKWVNTTINTVRGVVSSSWEYLDAKQQLVVTVLIPVNTRASIFLPSPSLHKPYAKEIKVGSGLYSYTIPWSKKADQVI